MELYRGHDGAVLERIRKADSQDQDKLRREDKDTKTVYVCLLAVTNQMPFLPPTQMNLLSISPTRRINTTINTL